MEKRLDKIEQKVDKIAEDVVDVKVSTAANTEALKVYNLSLQEHMAQTIEVRKQTEILFNGIEALKKEIDGRIKPLEITSDRVKFTGVVLGVLGGILVGLAEMGWLQPILQLFVKGH